MSTTSSSVASVKINTERRRKISIKIVAIAGIALLIIIIIVIIIKITIVKALAGSEYYLPYYNSESELGIYSSAAVSASNKNCARIGKNILKKGSAVDAAIVTLLCMGITNPQSLGLGGGFMMTIYIKNGSKVYFVNAREKAPLQATEYKYKRNRTLLKTGPWSIGVPGELKGYEEIHKKFGKLKWSEIFNSAINMCKSGTKVGKHLAVQLYLNSKEIEKQSEWTKIFINKVNNDFYKEGDKLLRPDLEKTLREIAKNGIGTLYNKTHPFAKRFISDLKKLDSIITAEDLEIYVPRIREPVNISIQKNLNVFSSFAPGSGAILGMMIKILDGYNIAPDIVADKDKSILTLHRILETFKYTFARRRELEDNEQTMLTFTKEVTSTEYAKKIRSKIDDNWTYDSETYLSSNHSIRKDSGRGSVAIIAPNGDAVVATSSINLPFGSLRMSKSTGIILNNHMYDFSLPNETSNSNSHDFKFNRVRPGKRPTSSISPTLVIDNRGNVRLALTASGGRQITTSILQVLLRNLWLNEDIKESIDAPRFHRQFMPNYSTYDRNFPLNVMDELAKRNHTFGIHGGLAGFVFAIARGEDGKLNANADYRESEGGVDGF